MIVDRGKIIARGSPGELLQKQYKNVIIELPLADITGDLDSIEHRLLETRGIIEIATDDVDGSLRMLQKNASDLNRMRIRQPNLEDLFLDLTGHSLRA